MLGGEGGIRTHGRHEAHNGFRDRPIQPLWHLSMSAAKLYLRFPRLNEVQDSRLPAIPHLSIDPATQLQV